MLRFKKASKKSLISDLSKFTEYLGRVLGEISKFQK